MNPVFTADQAAYQYPEFTIGKFTYGRPSINCAEGATICIGSFCSIADRVIIMSGNFYEPAGIGNYPFSDLDCFGFIKDLPKKEKSTVIIGNDVWIGSNVIINPNVTIGNGAVIAASSVVTSDVQPYEIVGGNPAKHIRFRFTEEQIKALQKIAWWDWDIEKIKDKIDLLQSKQIEAFIAAALQEK